MTPATAIALSGLTAATLKLTTSAANLVNAGDEARAGGPPAYRPRSVVDTPAPGGGVVSAAVTLSGGQTLAYDPASPLANGQGLVQAPEIDPVMEIGNQIAASRAFAFSLEALKAAQKDEKTLLDMTA